MDKVVLEADEFINRDDMRAELLGGLREERAAIREQLVNVYATLSDHYAQQINVQADRMFVPARDGA